MTTCRHPNPKLCRILGRHVHGRLWEIWTGRFDSRPLSAGVCEAYRRRWAERAGVELEAIRHLNAPSRGLGDLIAHFTAWLGFGACGGCRKRQRLLNRWFPFLFNRPRRPRRRQRATTT